MRVESALLIGVINVACVSTTHTIPTFSGPHLHDDLLRANTYCSSAEEAVQPTSGQKVMHSVSLVGMIVGGLVGGGGATVFLSETQATTPDPTTVGNTGGIALTGALIASISGLVYGFYGSEYEQSKAARFRVREVRSAADIAIVSERKVPTADKDVTSEQGRLPHEIASQCQTIWDERGEASQTGMNALVRGIASTIDAKKRQAKLNKEESCEGPTPHPDCAQKTKEFDLLMQSPP